jgi:hypothetical protein
MGRRSLTFVTFAAVCTAQQLSDFAGTWVVKVHDRPVISLTLTKSGDILTGSMTAPENLTAGPGGEITAMSGKQESRPIKKCLLRDGHLRLGDGDDEQSMTLIDANHATLGPAGMELFKLERVLAGTTVVLATTLPQAAYPPEITQLRMQLAAMVKEEQSARMAFDDARMKAADDKNRPEVLRIFEHYGWPKSSVTGADAARDFWLLVQHQTPEIQRRMLPEMEKAAKSGEASMSDYAYLYDRVQVGLGKPQRWGSQVQCKDGKPGLHPVEDPDGLDQRRKELFMMPIAEYLKLDYIVKSCAK